jgi:6-pyruvoyltetrahydropterin/6-carboxytetrahydropterin synthase
MIYVKRKEHFNAAHRLYNPKWSKERNEEVFGLCANEYYHGHNFELIVTVKGIPDPDTGFVVDMKKLGDLIETKIIDKVDHRNLNMDVDFMQGKMTSCEVFVIEIWKILAPAIEQLSPQAKLHSLFLQETNKNFVEYFGEGL